MGLLAKISQLVRRFRGEDSRRAESDEYRRCRFETMESRRLLSADPIRMGATYFEQDSGADLHGDTFEVTFVGGAPNTQMNRLVISTDQAAPGFSLGDNFFDIAAGGFGADQPGAFQIVSLHTQNPQATVTATVSDGSTELTLDFTGFQAGDKLVFTIDVDEVEEYDPNETNLSVINDGFDPITSGVEFQGSKLTGYFSADHYHDANGLADFRNKYDDVLNGTGLDLPPDDFGGKRDRSTGAVMNVNQIPLPIAISGHVYMDKDLDLVQDPGEQGISNVELSLWQKQGNGYVDTGHTTKTDADGRYEFGTDLNLLPGTYQVREKQPTGLFSVGAVPGTVEGVTSGATVPGDRDVLTEITIPLGNQHSINNDFAEAEPVRISGFVYHDRSNDGVRNNNEEGLPGVGIQVIPVNTIAPQVTLTLQTNGNGFYEATGLAPGTYRIVEPTQPTNFFDGLDTVGTVNGVAVGSVSNPGDSLENILLTGGQVGVNYNFGELAPVRLSGRVGLTDADGNCGGDEWREVREATVKLLDASGKVIAETKTNDKGEYEFTGLHPGQYSLVEITPVGLIDGDSHPGTVNGSDRGQAGVGTITQITLGSGQTGVDYDFCEHEPATVSGFVYHDENSSGVMEDGETPIGNTDVTLIDSSGKVIATQKTNSLGFYEFAGLSAGKYSVVESQPKNWLDGQDAPGQINGVTVGTAANPGDKISGINVRWGEESTRNNFGELLPGSISGQVHTDKNGDCLLDQDEETIEGVTIELLDADGNLLKTTKTDAEGRYQFKDLVPGTYGVRELQPAGVFQGGQRAGSHGGFDGEEDLITSIEVGSGQILVNYDFCEIPPASIHGMVFSDPNEDCEFNDGDTELSGVVVQLLNENDEILATTTTDAAGRYKFENLQPGVYSVRELQPAGYFHGGQSAGSAGGDAFSDDLISSIFVAAGSDLVDYDFCELPPASLAGTVFSDPNHDCEFNEGDTPLAGVTVQLLDQFGEIVATQVTNSQGKYQFENLPPGIYSVHELQPAGYFHGGQTAGSGGGDASIDDLIAQVFVTPGSKLVDYDFCELPPATLAGVVFADPNQDCEQNAGDTPLSGVTVQLLDDSGQVVATQTTNADGKYRFENLGPGTYSVREIQPSNYFQGGQSAGSAGGDVEVTDLIAGIEIAGGEHLVNYNFCEQPPARIAGNVYQDGPTIQEQQQQELTPQEIGQLRDGKQTPDDTPLPGVMLQLRDGFTGEAIDSSEALPGLYPPGPIQVRTDANGHYEFAGIPGGRSYAVYEVHPTGYIDGIDTVGTTTGFAFNPQSVQGEIQLEPLAGQPANDAIIRIGVAPGQISDKNNFSEVKVESVIIPPIKPPPPINFPPPPNNPPPLLPPQSTPIARTAPIQSVVTWITPHQNVTVESFASMGYSWHLSVVNGGMPRDIASSLQMDEAVWRSATYLEQTNWAAEHMREARWVLGTNPQGDQRRASRSLVFGIRGGIPFAGDFNGDGTSEIGVFYRGEWFVDLNGNGVWDEADLWAKLGDEMDRPVVGDWDGDSKDDIGIYGPEWYGDQRQIVRESGLPDSQNLDVADAQIKPKNVPPTKEDATDGQRLLRLNAQGPRRADVIDHVFRYGDVADVPVAGDWNGDGIRTVGIFRAGEWRVDTNGDGVADSRDKVFHFGDRGDIPVVGDWDGNGIEEIGVYRSGRWILDINGNRELDAYDKVFEMGGATDRPVVGDWNGDGIDEPGIYRELPPSTDVPVNN